MKDDQTSGETSLGTWSAGPVVRLKSLAPQYDASQHGTYLNLLEDAIADPKNRNIALSGRYGTGKSSVLDQFEELHKEATLRLAISTLAPDSAGATLTNRIQKEVLKQLIYSALPRTLRNSRFGRRAPISWRRTFVESIGAVAVVAALLALLGLLPPVIGTGPSHPLGLRLGAWVTVVVLTVAVIVAIRKLTDNRFVVSSVSAAGATISLTTPTSTYFDEYLDELVYFFDREDKDFVVFEDIDRYNDPLIFQALRELNTLLNNTPKRRGMITHHQEPLRFVYAVRDSLFEKLGEDTTREVGDAVHTETIRANRTKFFEIVIPIVPFISHRTAREHLRHLLDEAQITDIDRSLIELVARHATDMRLLLNIRNEYMVFAERLLASKKVAPEITASRLFALVAYKSFHLQDFENIARRSSSLDLLYDYHRALVSQAVSRREATKRELLAGEVRPPDIGPFAARLGRRLAALAMLERERIGSTNYPDLGFTVGSTQHGADDILTPAFWEAVVESRAITLWARPGRGYAHQTLATLSQEHLEGLFPEVLAGRWQDRSNEAVQTKLSEIATEIDELRGCDFRDLAVSDRYTLSVDPDTLAVSTLVETPETNDVSEAIEVTFGVLVDRTLGSELARGLVRQGYIDQNFTLYSAQFYGDFTGADVATFIVQTVQTNGIDMHYRFTSPGAVENLLAETDEDFVRTISVYNVQVVDHLLVHDTDRADQVVGHLTTHFGLNARQFLSAFFTSGTHRPELAARLSHRPWAPIFTYLAGDEGVPADMRASLLDAALRAALPKGAYDLSPEVALFLEEHYEEMPAFTEPLGDAELDTVLSQLRRAEVSFPSLQGVHEELRERLVDERMYELTVDNLRVALGTTGEVALDDTRGHDAVYQYCLADLDGYLSAVDADKQTASSVRKPENLVDTLRVLTANGADHRDIERLLASASKESKLERLADAPPSHWTALAAAGLFQASLENLAAYRSATGTIDPPLGRLLVAAGALSTGGAAKALQVDTTDSQDQTAEAAPDAMAEAVALLNASVAIPAASDRVTLVQTLGLAEPLVATGVHPEPSDLFALLLESGVVADDAATFAHLASAGWAAVKPAALVSRTVADFITPDLLGDMVCKVFSDPAVARKLGKTVAESLDEYVPTDDPAALEGAAHFAVEHGLILPVKEVLRIAANVKDPVMTVRLLHISDADPAEIVQVLGALGGRYSFVATWEQDEFEIPDDIAHEDVFRRLHEAGMAQVRKKPRKPIYVVRRPQ